MSEWRDISSAPKDGTDIMLWCHFSLKPSIAICRYHESGRAGAHGRFVWLDQGGSTIAERIPTHWMPLPEPPQTVPEAA